MFILFNSVDVRDLAEGVIAACRKGRRGECYIMSNEVVTMHEMFDLMNEAAGLSGRSYVLSKELAHIGVRVLGLAGKFTGREPLLSEFNIYMLNRNKAFDDMKESGQESDRAMDLRDRAGVRRSKYACFEEFARIRRTLNTNQEE